jgi:hypothetical protein
MRRRQLPRLGRAVAVHSRRQRLSHRRKFWREGLDAAWHREPAGGGPLDGQCRFTMSENIPTPGTRSSAT